MMFVDMGGFLIILGTAQAREICMKFDAKYIREYDHYA